MSDVKAIADRFEIEALRGEFEARLRDAVSRRLAELGVGEPQVAVERREELPRSAGGKLQLVVADPAAWQASLGRG
jgi:hypothetical protein